MYKTSLDEVRRRVGHSSHHQTISLIEFLHLCLPLKPAGNSMSQEHEDKDEQHDEGQGGGPAGQPPHAAMKTLLHQAPEGSPCWSFHDGVFSTTASSSGTTTTTSSPVISELGGDGGSLEAADRWIAQMISFTLRTRAALAHREVGILLALLSEDFAPRYKNHAVRFEDQSNSLQRERHFGFVGSTTTSSSASRHVSGAKLALYLQKLLVMTTTSTKHFFGPQFQCPSVEGVDRTISVIRRMWQYHVPVQCPVIICRLLGLPSSQQQQQPPSSSLFPPSSSTTTTTDLPTLWDAPHSKLRDAFVAAMWKKYNLIKRGLCCCAVCCEEADKIRRERGPEDGPEDQPFIDAGVAKSGREGMEMLTTCVQPSRGIGLEELMSSFSFHDEKQQTHQQQQRSSEITLVHQPRRSTHRGTEHTAENNRNNSTKNNTLIGDDAQGTSQNPILLESSAPDTSTNNNVKASSPLMLLLASSTTSLVRRKSSTTSNNKEEEDEIDGGSSIIGGKEGGGESPVAAPSSGFIDPALSYSNQQQQRTSIIRLLHWADRDGDGVWQFFEFVAAAFHVACLSLDFNHRTFKENVPHEMVRRFASSWILECWTNNSGMHGGAPNQRLSIESTAPFVGTAESTAQHNSFARQIRREFERMDQFFWEDCTPLGFYTLA